MFRSSLACTLLMLAACSEQQFSHLEPDPVEANADIDVAPPALSFPMLADGDQDIQTFTITNVGTAPLTVDDVRIDGPDSFTILSTTISGLLDPGASMDIDVAFTPLQEDQILGTAIVSSDDPDEAEVPVALEGWAAAPQLTIDPDPVDFGTAFVSCDDSQKLTLENTGMDTLTITDLKYKDGGVGALTLESGLTLPLDLAPGETAKVIVDFLPMTVDSFAGTLSVTSNDPRGVVTATQTGASAYASTVTDAFDVPLDPPVDIIFAVDQSCSMDDNAADLGAAFNSFITTIGTVTSDWRIGVTTHDDGCFNYGILDANTPDYQGKFEKAVVEGTDLTDNYTEKLFKQVDIALGKIGANECNANFLRPGALLHVIFVSDEKERSGTSWSTWLAGWQPLVSDPALIKASSIIDMNKTCGDGSGPAGYEEIALNTGGLELNICNANWSQYAADLASASLTGLGTYILTQTPDETSLTVMVDGVQWFTGWHYDAASNQIIFDDEVPKGAHIEVTYGTLACL